MVAKSYAETVRALVDREKSMTVLLSSEGFLGGGRGSGVLLDETHILTCAHMVDKVDDEFFVYTYPFGSVIKAHAEMVDKQDDMALLVLSSSITVHYKLEFDTNTYDGQPITVVGNALGAMKWLVTRGVLSGTEGDDLITDASTQHGNSGGPWFDDQGKLVAITNWGLNNRHGDGEVAGITGGLSAKRIAEILEEYKEQQAMKGILATLLGGN